MNRWARGALAVASLAGATVLASVLEAWIGVENASAVYLLAVATVAILAGTIPMLATALASFVLYNFLFVEPRFSLSVARPQSLMTLLLLLVVGIVIGRLTALGRQRADESGRREREARALFIISQALASAAHSEEALPTVAAEIVAETEMDRIWITLGTTAHARIAADTGAGPAPSSTHAIVLGRSTGREPARWLRIHAPVPGFASRRVSGDIFRVDLSAGEERFGSLFAQRHGRPGDPSVETTRLMLVAAEQIAQAARRDRLAQRARDVEVAERSDAAKSALLDLVSHELRTPLATIRASAGSLADPDVSLSEDERRTIALAIDSEAIRLNRLVGNLLDMSRLRAGRMTADLEVIPVEDAVEALVERAAPMLGDHVITVTMPRELPPVLADATFLEQILTNLLDNAARYSPDGTTIHVSGAATGEGMLEIRVEDGGPGVPDAELERIFERFYRGNGSRGPLGTGLGLPLVRGLSEAMGGQVSARRSHLGGLSVSVRLPSAPVR